MADVGQQVLEACGAAGLLPLSPLADHPSVSSSLTSQLTSQADTRPPSTHTPPNTPSILILCAWACQSRNGTWGPVPRRGSGVPEVSSLQWPGSGCLVRASWQQRWSKPAPGMLQAAMEAAGARPSDTLYVGSHGYDKAAAAAAQVRFIWAVDFFGRTRHSF